MTKIPFIKSFQCAIEGIFKGISKERSLKIQLIIGLFIIILSIILDISKIYLITIIIVVFLVIILELFNKNFERLIDLVSPNYKQECGEIKDTMAGIVLVSSILSIIVGVLILYEPLIKFLKLISKSPLPIFLIIINIIITVIILLYKKNNY